MTNNDFMRSYLKQEDTHGANGHLGYTGGKLWNYSTVICEIDAAEHTARVNVRKYSSTTSKIQSALRGLLDQGGWIVEEYDGEPCTYWNYGYMGAPTWNKSDFAPVR